MKNQVTVTFKVREKDAEVRGMEIEAESAAST